MHGHVSFLWFRSFIREISKYERKPSYLVFRIQDDHIQCCLSNNFLDKSAWVDLKKEALALTEDLPDVRVVEISRGTDGVSHEIAKFCESVTSGGVLNDVVRSCLRDKLGFDCKNVTTKEVSS